MAGSKTKRGGANSRDRFIPVLVTGCDEAERERVSGVLGAALDRPMETAPLASLDRSLIARAGVVVLATVSTEEPAAKISSALTRVRAGDPSVPILVLGEWLEGRDVAAAIRAGADDVLYLDVESLDPVAQRIDSWIARRSVRFEGSLFGDGAGMPRFIGGSDAIRETVRMVGKIAPTDATALILGESGTGKELIARAIHALSPRKAGPFIAINCAAIPDTLLENELFGHERGAYTGASTTAIGKVEAANKGTLFLDEIGEMPIQLQAKILRLLQEKTFDRIGGTSSKSADIRIIAATNVDLKRQIAAGRFREDLYYRLSVVPLVLPALRDRSEDIPLLVGDIVERLAVRLERPGLSVSREAMRRIVAHRWPGNVRELENELERAAVLSRSDSLESAEFELNIKVSDPEWQMLKDWLPPSPALEAARERAVERVTRVAVSRVMGSAAGDIEEAARQLEIEPERLRALLDGMAGGSDD